MRIQTMFGLVAACGLLLMGDRAWPQSPRHEKYPETKPALGEKAPDFTLTELNGKEFRLKDVVGKRPIVIEFGSYS